MTLRNIEHVVNNKGEVLITEQDERPYVLNQTHRHIITATIDDLKEEWPAAYACLEKRYYNSRQNKMYFDFLIARMWMKLHYGQVDQLLDIDESGNLNMEYCYCPKRGECDTCDLQAACYPVRSTKLRKSEINVLRLLVAGLDESAIAETLNIEVCTVKNHRNNMLKRLDLHKTSQLIDYWNKNKMK
jgi:DNA-binding CsgD family transcriptional regulator